MGQYFTTFCAILTYSIRGAKKHRRRRYSSSAHRLARSAVMVVALRIANSFLQGSPLIFHPSTEDTPLQEFALRAFRHR
jgi:hypothetical protein